MRSCVDDGHFLGLGPRQAQRRPLPMAFAAGNRQQIHESPLRIHHGIVPEAACVDVLDDLFLLRIEHLPVASVRRLIQETAGYCWPTSFNVLGVLFLGEVSSAFLPSKTASWTPKFRPLGVGQQYPALKRDTWQGAHTEAKTPFWRLIFSS